MKYSNPIAQEVICFIGFEARAGEEIFSTYYEKISDVYPTFAPVLQHTITLGFGPEGILPPQQSFQQPMRYTRKDRRSLITLVPNGIALHLVKPYPGWSEMMKEIRHVWDKLIEAIQRYINVIQSQSETEVLGFWLKSNEFIPEGILNSYPFDSYQIQRNYNNGNDAMRVSIAKGLSPIDPLGVFIWEIERTKIGSFSIDVNQMSNIINELHQDVRSVFDTAIGSNLKTLMHQE
jgi:uncharacterized protein (TIGR04255 family)